MSGYTTKDIRNVVLLGHAGSGKTTLVESLLHAAGAAQSPGSVEKGNTLSDDDALERKHCHSLRSSLISVDRNGCHINLIDTPGYPDFVGHALGALPAVETAALVVNAQTGIQTMTRRFEQWTSEHKQCRIIVINHIDAEGVNLEGLLAQIRETFGDECMAINLPAENATKVVDCFFTPSGEADFWLVDDAHTAVIDQTVEVDERLMEQYLEHGKLEPRALHDAFEKALREGHLVPVCFVSAKMGTGIPELLEVFGKLLPNPAEGNRPLFVREAEDAAEPVAIKPEADGDILCHVFKVMHDPYVGKLGVFRIHHGTVTKNSELHIDDNPKPFKVGHLFKMHGGKHEEIDEGVPGDLCAVAKVGDIHFGSVLHNRAKDSRLRLQLPEVPLPLAGLAVKPRKRGDEQKLAEALEKLTEEDPGLTVERDPDINEMILRGQGDLHLRTALERMEEVYNVAVDSKPPTIPYRETITKKSEGHHRHKKQSGGAGQFGEVYLRIEPLKRGMGFEFVTKVVGGVIPNQFIPSVEKGVREVYQRGAVAGYPMQDVRVTVYDGKYHSVDSNEVSFISAGRKAFQDAIDKAKPIVMEPMVNIEVTVPHDNMGDITGDLSSRRGRVSNTNVQSGGFVTIEGQAPLAELEDYQSKLNSISGGEGSYTMQFSHYDPMPANLRKDLISRFEKKEE
ncbi:MAG: Elongation factor G-like protein [Gammaproteobacteria bacterium]|nr:Elongation factor G-like protein [Gammaproteobacteria bacterium]